VTKFTYHTRNQLVFAFHNPKVSDYPDIMPTRQSRISVIFCASSPFLKAHVLQYHTPKKRSMTDTTTIQLQNHIEKTARAKKE